MILRFSEVATVYLVERPHLQLALDMLDMDLALNIALQTDEFVDLFEAGTPLIKYNGIQAVSRLKDRFGAKPIVADLKIVDAADTEVAMAASAGADVVTVMANAPIETLRMSIQRAHSCGLRVIVDLLGITDVVTKASDLQSLPIDFLLVHTGIDQQRRGAMPLGDVEQLARTTEFSLGVAGGLQVSDIPRIRNIPNLDLIVVGGAITSSLHPDAAARQFREALNR